MNCRDLIGIRNIFDNIFKGMNDHRSRCCAMRYPTLHCPQAVLNYPYDIYIKLKKNKMLFQMKSAYLSKLRYHFILYIFHQSQSANFGFPASISSCGSLSLTVTMQSIQNANWLFICVSSGLLVTPPQICLRIGKGWDSGDTGHPGHVAHDMRSNHSYN